MGRLWCKHSWPVQRRVILEEAPNTFVKVVTLRFANVSTYYARRFGDDGGPHLGVSINGHKDKSQIYETDIAVDDER